MKYVSTWVSEECGLQHMTDTSKDDHIIIFDIMDTDTLRIANTF